MSNQIQNKQPIEQPIDDLYTKIKNLNISSLHGAIVHGDFEIFY